MTLRFTTRELLGLIAVACASLAIGVALSPGMPTDQLCAALLAVVVGGAWYLAGCRSP